MNFLKIKSQIKTVENCYNLFFLFQIYSLEKDCIEE